MFCINCGAEITDNNNYCSNCGQNLSKYQKSSDIAMKHSEINLYEQQWKKVLHEPIAPYLTSSYNIQNNLVEGLVLAVTFMVTFQYWGQMNLPILLKIFYCIGFVIVMWHNSLLYQQYIVTRISFFEKIIPIMIGVFQCFLALSVAQPIYIFTLIIIPLKSLLVINLFVLYRKHKNPISFEIWKEHYRTLGSDFAQDMYDEYVKSLRSTVRQVFIVIILISILTLFNYFAPLDSAIKTYISFIILVIFLIMSTYFDLNYSFNNSEKLKKYGYKW